MPFSARDVAEFAPHWVPIAKALAPVVPFDYGAWDTEGVQAPAQAAHGTGAAAGRPVSTAPGCVRSGFPDRRPRRIAAGKPTGARTLSRSVTQKADNWRGIALSGAGSRR